MQLAEEATQQKCHVAGGGVEKRSIRRGAATGWLAK